MSRASPQSNRDLSVSILEQRDRFADLQLRLVAQDARGIVQPDARRYLQVGGRWDNLLKRYVEDAPRTMVLGLHGGQAPAAQFLAQWFAAKARGEQLREHDKAIYSLLLHGGRRAGKTDLAAKSGVAYAVMRPRSWVWMVSENIPKTEELLEAIKGWMPTEWYRELGAPHYTLTLLNGSVIWLRSAHKPQSLKRGRCDYAVLNEAQNMDELAYTIVRAATADNGGLTVLAANPSDTARGYWVDEFFEQARASKRNAREFHLDASQNPHVDFESLLAMQSEVDDRTFRREIKGEFLPRTDVVFYSWGNGQDGNVQPAPEIETANITRQFTKRVIGWEFDCVLGMDFQNVPYPCAVDVRFFVDPDDPRGVLGDPLVWLVDFTLVENGGERDLSAALLAKGYDPRRTMLVPDASGSWQTQDRKHRTGQRQYGSHDILRECGWLHVYKPDEHMERNPLILDRVRGTLALIKTATGKRRLFSDPKNIALNQAMLRWENRGGVPYRRSPFAHLCDAATYPLHRFFPHRGFVVGKAPTKSEIQVLEVQRSGPRPV